MLKEAIIIGAGNLAFLCAKEVRNQGFVCRVIENESYQYSLLPKFCEKEGFPYFNLKKEEVTEHLLQIDHEALVVSANSIYLVPDQVVKKENLIIINFHPALLPKHPGRNAEAWSIYEQDRVTGITWHYIDEKIDHGEIIIQEKIDITDRTTSLTLMRQQFLLGAQCFQKIIPIFLKRNARYVLKHINSECKKYRCHLSKETPNNGILDPKWEIETISSFLRAMDYGKLKVLGEPLCRIGEITFVWDRYSIETNHMDIKTNEMKGIFADKRNVIKLLNFRRSEYEGCTL